MTPSKDKPEYWDGAVPWVSPKDMKVPVLSDSIDHVSEHALSATGLRLHPVDSVMVVTRGMILAHTFPVARNAVPVTVNQDMKVLRAVNGVEPRYLSWMLQGLQSVMLSLTDESAHGTKALRTDQWENLPVPIPTSSLQAGIANFLDQQTIRIDALIAEKERLVECLTELRYATVSWAVTGGLHAARGTWETGNPFVCKLPTGWKLGGLTKFIGAVVDYRGKTPEKVEQGVLLVTARNIRNGFLDYTASAEFVRPEDYQEIMRRGRPQLGDVLFTTEAPLGEVANVDREDIALAQRVVKFRGHEGIIDNFFLKYWLMGDAAQATLSTLATGSTAEGIKASKLGQIPLAVPSMAEQREVVEYLEHRRLALDDAANHVKEHIDRLREYRSSLITAAVTGQLGNYNFTAH